MLTRILTAPGVQSEPVETSEKEFPEEAVGTHTEGRAGKARAAEQKGAPTQGLGTVTAGKGAGEPTALWAHFPLGVRVGEPGAPF